MEISAIEYHMVHYNYIEVPCCVILVYAHWVARKSVVFFISSSNVAVSLVFVSFLPLVWLYPNY